MTIVAVTKAKLDALAEAIGIKAERRVPLTLDEMKFFVEGLPAFLQKKTVEPKKAKVLVVPDEGYDALSEVVVEPMKLQQTNLTIDSGGVNNIVPSAGYDGLSSVRVFVPSATLPTTVSSYSSGAYKAAISRSSSTKYLNIPAGYNNSSVYYSITSTPNMTLPTATSGTSSGTSKLAVTPGTTDKYINIPTGYNSTASYYTISGDADLVPSSIVSGKTIFGVEGSATASTISQDENTKVLSIS